MKPSRPPNNRNTTSYDRPDSSDSSNGPDHNRTHSQHNIHVSFHPENQCNYSKQSLDSQYKRQAELVHYKKLLQKLLQQKQQLLHTIADREFKCNSLTKKNTQLQRDNRALQTSILQSKEEHLTRKKKINQLKSNIFNLSEIYGKNTEKNNRWNKQRKTIALNQIKHLKSDNQRFQIFTHSVKESLSILGDKKVDDSLASVWTSWKKVIERAILARRNE